MNIKITIAYDGTRFSGWQIQPGRDTVQGALLCAIQKITGQKVDVLASGRTDAGTHALAQVANFHVTSAPTPASFRRALNGALPRDVRIRRLEIVDEDFHARRDALRKSYRYQIYTGPVVSPFEYRYYYHFTYDLEMAPMIEAARALLGEHDFTSFAAAATTAKSAVRTLYRSEVRKVGYRLFYQVEGNGFLQHMVRNIVGTLLEVGTGKRKPYSMANLLKARDRRMAGPTAPSQGLFLVRVKY
ncbi:MAG: tRNA pseudouridine(38-40) synthase TruA [Acidobacteria bacterium]|nr:tRNA pseudouridine(38-40) synthase TruA [Acidobacteriota bacterium]MBI3656164.1 tRNA pseudouridine(38-40) synthase TruA [Acidobacteriota bacterium]